MDSEELCSCMSANGTHDQFRLWRELGTDTTNGRYADVSVS